jgi:hypothetical protein
MMRHTGKFPVHCPVCHRGLCNASHLEVHIKMHTGEAKFECQFCQKRFITCSNMKKHIKAVHESLSGSHRHRCTVCSERFTSKAELQKHEESHEKVNCEICQSSFPNEKQKRFHLRMAHPDALPFKCAECKRGFICELSFAEHNRKFHGGNSESLKMSAATAETEHKCPFCKKNSPNAVV